MPCSITAGRTVSCKDAVSGIRNVYIANYIDIPAQTGYTIASGLITVMATTPLEVYEYAVRRESSKLDISIATDPKAGTTHFEQRLTLQFNKLNKDDADAVKILAYDRVVIIVQDNQDNLLVLGARNGMDMEGSSMTTGQNYGDQSGFSLTFVGREINEALWCKPSAGPTTALAPFDECTGVNVN